ncbi:endonuclease domain-containing protein [Parerythrobacter lacustris]|uniref:DUF559 domain-containing protein n=1 Tax=Parerythrobacter lacustris TaxID=2969984 RepID=A0ABT1XQK1_9SPHN|nr:DUF559 domain-containing protein [Parerythrobacter lacustris]MCR2833944.1 DUF559 domain-containing protein [Parerythrobacter lacustris]
MAEKRLTSLARKLRSDMTDAERQLWSRLCAKQLGVQFTRQHQIGNFIVDFACRSLRLAIECDGGQHSDSPTDTGRTEVIEAHGYRVIRFWNNDILENTDGVVEAILEEMRLARNQDQIPLP